MLFFKELDREKNNVSVHMERQKSTQSHSKPKEESMTAGIVVMTSDHTTEIQTGRPAEQSKETNKGVKIRSWKQRQSIQKSGDSQTVYLPVEPSG